MPLQEGEVVGPYRIISPLGQGGMATVYKGYHENLDRYVAIKMMHQGFLEDPSFLARFKREAQIVARLEHPHIVPVYDYSEYEGQPYLVMKFIEGATLRDDSSRGTLPLKQVIHIMAAVGSALTYAHERGVLHRDIKPSNMVIDKQNVPYVTDFGLARMVQAGESTLSQDMILGTPHYISPEQAKGAKDVDARADIYSLGVVLYKLVVGQVPFMGDTPYAIIHDHIYTPLPLPSIVNPDVSPQIEAVLLKALAKQPGERYSSAVELVEAFRDAAQHEPGVAQPRAPSAKLTTGKKPSTRASTAVAQKTPKLVTVPAPGGAPTVIERTPTLRRPAPKRNMWMLGGIGALLLICLASTVIVLNIASSAAQLQGLNGSGASLDTGAIPSFEVPTLSIEEAEQLVEAEPANPAARLALVQALWNEGSLDEAQVVLNEGIAQIEEPVIYLVNAARQAAEADQSDIAGVLYVQALNRAQATDTLYARVRAEAGQYLYEIAVNVQRLNLRDANQLSNRIPIGALPLARAMIARGLISAGHPIMAQSILSELLQEDPALAETHLVVGELRQTQENREQALAEWELAANAEDAPDWVKSRAEELIELASGD